MIFLQFGLVSTKFSKIMCLCLAVGSVGYLLAGLGRASCLCSMKSPIPHQDGLGLFKWWWLFPRERSSGSVLTHCHFCYIPFARSSHRSDSDSKDREIDNTHGSEEPLNHTTKDVNKGQNFGVISTRNLSHPNSSTHTR